MLSSAVRSHRWGPQPTANARGKRPWWAQERGSSIKRDNGSLGSTLSKSSPCLCSGCVPLKHIHSAPRFWIPVLTLGISPRHQGTDDIQGFKGDLKSVCGSFMVSGTQARDSAVSQLSPHGPTSTRCPWTWNLVAKFDTNEYSKNCFWVRGRGENKDLS